MFRQQTWSFPFNHFVYLKWLESSCCFLVHSGSSLGRLRTSRVEKTSANMCRWKPDETVWHRKGQNSEGQVHSFVIFQLHPIALCSGTVSCGWFCSSNLTWQLHGYASGSNSSGNGLALPSKCWKSENSWAGQPCGLKIKEYHGTFYFA